ncbi:ferredoxin [archaeon CG10_big_fil_rev_8_21_14_0_10_43_11]|nr:MAG: ferredoxin [archaeon CG10_big_fil_rev_8_21_14_0_10_43_11]
MNVTVDEQTCIGCGSCEAICPKAFYLIDGLAKVKKDHAATNGELEEAIDICPVDAIKKVEKKD